MARWLVGTLMMSCLFLPLGSCSPSPVESEMEIPAMTVASPGSNPNQALLDQANRLTSWFHARKTRPIWARELVEDQQVRTLEGLETVRAGHYLCKGEAGDIWPQTKEQLEKRYSATDETLPDGWHKYLPRADAQGVLAVQLDQPFAVQTAWGQLAGKPGDYLVKNFQDRDVAYPDDVWIVDQKLFRETYERVEMLQ